MKKIYSIIIYFLGILAVILSLIFYSRDFNPLYSFLGMLGIMVLFINLSNSNSCIYKSQLLILLIVGFAGWTIIPQLIPYQGISSDPEIAVFIVLVLIILGGYGILKQKIYSKAVSTYMPGFELTDNRKYQEANDYFDKILKNNPDDYIAWACKSVALKKLGRPDEQDDARKKALDGNFDHKSFLIRKNLQSLLLSIIGHSYLGSEEYEKAMEYADKSLEINNKNVYSMNIRGISLIKLERPNESIKYFNEALKLNPKAVNVLNNKADALRKMGEYNNSLKLINKSLKFGPEKSFIWLTKAEILIDMKKEDEAHFYLNKALEIDPGNEDALKLQNKYFI